MAKKFKVGDVVCLNSGSPQMTVHCYVSVLERGSLTEMEETTQVECHYYEGTVRKTATHEEDTLKLADEQ
jgi:uncharacterized protein YodC (DUF2158 family)